MKTGGSEASIMIKMMSKNIWNEFVFGSHLVALGDVLALYAMSVILNINVTISFFIVVYLSILAINFFNRYEEADQDATTNPERSDSVNKYFKFTPYIMVALTMIPVGITTYFAPIGAIVFMLFLFAVGIIYSIFLKNITKQILCFKDIMTALPYALVVIFMALFYNSPITLATGLVATFYFIRMFINTTFFDIKDTKADKKESLRTFPVIFGENKTKLFLIFLNIVSIIPVAIGIYLKVLPAYSIVLLVTVIYAFLYLNKRKLFRNQTTIYNVVVDGEFIFWLPYLLIGKIIL
ncbi:MAG TPA: UbiA family prenyltransferase [Candidatus Saccharimonadales bacterium]|nr:UbiA family prenyltransferase [Candidatus Saccharimonadales bacterium]